MSVSEKTALKLEKFRKFMLKKGYNYLTVYYDGCGDSGECYEMEGHKSSTMPEEHAAEQASRSQWNNSTGEFEKVSEEEAYSKCNYDQYDVLKSIKQYNKENKENVDEWTLIDCIEYDFCNGEGGQGRLVFDLKKGVFIVFGEQNYQSCSYTLEKHKINGESEIINRDDQMPQA
ncbi:MAG: hypothetical protein CMD28_02120 [Flavobacteriales bacterium]|nr:hypothetical protein [Flavobacteriales bacterium]